MLRFIVIHIAVVVLVGLYPLHAELSTIEVLQGKHIYFVNKLLIFVIIFK
jgi:hypothetical protein